MKLLFFYIWFYLNQGACFFRLAKPSFEIQHEIKIKLKKQLNPVFLIGLMGSGKTTIGKLLSTRLGYNFIDTDKFLEEQTGESITTLFQHGESYFREIESKVLDDISHQQRTIVATGGGIVTKDKNWEYLKRGFVVYLEVSPSIIAARLAQEKDECLLSRPLLKDLAKKKSQENPMNVCEDQIHSSSSSNRLKLIQSRLQHLLEKRKPYYEKADLVVRMDDCNSTEESLQKLLLF